MVAPPRLLAVAQGCALLVFLLPAGPVLGATPLAECLEASGIVRVARVIGPDGRAGYVRVVAQEAGVPTAVVPIADDGEDLALVFERARALGNGAPAWPIPEAERADRVCAAVRLGQPALDDGSRIVVAAGLNYAAHAEEAGGGDVFVFPKPAAPTPPYGQVAAPAGAMLLDYEVELGLVLLRDVDLRELPSRDALLAGSAFFVANDLSDREPIIRDASLTGGSTGFVEAKGQPGFLPAGPWLVHGTELFAALDACGEAGLGIGLDVDEGAGFQVRQDATTAAMILDPVAFLARIATEVDLHGPASTMPFPREDGAQYYPIARSDDVGERRWLPAGSIVLTGTPEGVAMNAPSPLAVTARGLVRLRGPFEQFAQEERERAASGEPGGYLAPGDRVRSRIDGLGAQIVRVAEPGSPLAPDPCGEGLP
jgi:2-keto-4-pentenoate hydratase/2-oxohepta-3-ene-1,7-dioic acid hydratase in catechol pathway